MPAVARESRVNSLDRAVMRAMTHLNIGATLALLAWLASAATRLNGGA